MADSNLLPVEFSIVGFEQMQKDFSALSSRVDDLAGSVSKNSKAITSGFKDVASNAKRSIASTTANLRSLLPVLGGTQAQFLMMASNVGEQFEKLATATGSTAALIKGGMIVAVAAASYEFGKWLAEIAGVNQAIDELYKSAQQATIINAKVSDGMRDLESASQAYDKAVSDASQKSRVFGESTEAAGSEVEATEKYILAIDSAISQFTAGEKELTDQLAAQTVKVWNSRAAYEAMAGSIKSAADAVAASEMERNLRTQEEELKRLQVAHTSVTQKIDEANASINDQINLYGDLVTIQRMYEEDAKRKAAEAKIDPGFAGFPGADLAKLESKNLTDSRIEDQKRLADAMRMYDIPTIQSDQIAQAEQQWRSWIASLQVNVADVQEFISGTFEMVSRGVGDALARAIVYGEDLGQAFVDLGKQILATVISTFVQLLLQQLMYLVMGYFMGAADLTAKIANMAAFAAASMQAWAFAIGGPLGFAMGPGMALAAAAMTVQAGAAGAGVGAAAGPGIAAIGAAGGLFSFGEGAYVRSPVMAIVGDAPGGEIVAPRSDYENMIAGTRQPSVGNVYLDGRELTQSVVKWIPGEVRRKGVRRI